MTPPECPDLPQPNAEHAINEEAIREEDRFELETPDRGFLAGPRSRFHDLGTIFRVGAVLLMLCAVALSSSINSTRIMTPLRQPSAQLRGNPESASVPPA